MSIIKHNIKFNKNKTVTGNLIIVIMMNACENNHVKLNENYNVLNKLYSFITKKL